MRRLIPSSDLRDERGATMVFVAVTIAVLLAMTAFAFDFGRIWAEQRELQTGADAAALAIAQDCIDGECDTAGYDATVVAEDYADANAKDSAAWVPLVDLDLAAQQVQVQTATETADGRNQFDMSFAGAIGFDGLTVTSDATVAWGPPAGLATLPIIFSICEWESYGTGFVEDGGFLHHAGAVHDGQLPPAPGYAYENKYTTIYFHGDEEPCHESPSGQDLPGGFGWLDTAGTCEAQVDPDDWVFVDPGDSPTSGCSNSDLKGLLGTVVLVPYFDDLTGTGSNARYHVAGYGAYYLTGYYFAGQYREKSLIDNTYPCNGSDRCLQGYFLGDWVVSEGGIGTGPNLGVTVIAFED
jgi:Flp pilus assembly protein TadG